MNFEEWVDEPGLTAGALRGAVGGIVMAAAHLEVAVQQALIGMSSGPITKYLVQGERGSTLTAMAIRVIRGALGSTVEDEATGRTARLGMLSLAETERAVAIMKRCESLLKQRDHVAHAMWILGGAGAEGIRITRSNEDRRRWTPEALTALEIDLLNAAVDVFEFTWNITAAEAGMPRIPARLDEVVDP